MVTYKNDIKVEDYLNLRDLVNWRKITQEQATKALNGSVYIVAAYEKEKAVGVARVVGDGTYMCLIVDVIVHPEYQNKKIGTNMINNIIYTLENSISEDEIMMINLMSVPGKESYYEKFGLAIRPNKTMGSGMCRWLNVK